MTVAVAVACELPSAVIELGFKATLSFAAGPGVCVSVADPENDRSLAVMVYWPAFVVEVTVAL
jgi:hypothetical protein